MLELDFNEIQRAIEAVAPTGTFEIRMLGTRKGQIDAGYFDSPAEAASAICSQQGWYTGVYITPNPVNPDVMARSYNRITPWSKITTTDPEILRRRWLMVDVDAKRPTGISSSEAEHQAALKQARTIADTLTLYGFPTPMLADSGNGAHLMYRIDEENTEEVRDEIQTFIHALRALFSTEGTDVDITVFNAARIWRVYGTYARKGDSTPDRPHRKSRILQYADPFKVVSIVQLLRFNSMHASVAKAAPVQRESKNAFDYPDDEKRYKRLNEYAMRNMRDWVPHFFPEAREYKEGYRVSSADIGEDYEEDLTLHPWPLGIKYFGVSDQDDATEGRRTPISVVAQYSLHTDKAAAAQALSDKLNFPISEFEVLPTPATSAALQDGGMGDLLGTKPKFSFANIRTVADLQRKEFKEIKWVVQDVIPTGNIMLAARPKMRKTWLALQLAMAISEGGKFLDYQCNKGDVLFLGLEDNERRMQNRIRTLTKFNIVPPDLRGFRYWTGGMDYDGAGNLKVSNPEEAAATLQMFPRGEAGVDALEQYLEEFPNTTTIIIDTLAHFRGDRSSRDIYQSDYDSMMPITRLASRKEVCIIPVHHEKKGNADRERGGDFLEDISGSAGISGGIDGAISIKGRRGVQEENESRKILITGRDIPYDYEIDVAFDAERGGWLKAAKEDVKVTIRTLLDQHGYLNQQDLVYLISSVSKPRIYKALMEMKMEGEVEQSKYGYNLKR